MQPLLTAATSPEAIPVVAYPDGGGGIAAAWKGARKRWLLAGLFGLATGGGAAATFYSQTPQKHTVTTVLQIESPDPLIHSRETRNLDLEYRRTQVALIRTRPVIRKALENPKVANSSLLKGKEDPAGWLETEVKSIQADGGLIRVSLSGENPEELATTLNAVTAAYLTVVVDAEETQRRIRELDLDKALAMSEDRVRKKQSELRALAETLRTSDTEVLTFKQQMTIQHYSRLQGELAGIEAQLRAKRAEVDVQKVKSESAKSQPFPENVVADALTADTLVKGAAEQATRARDQLETSAANLQPGSAAHNKLVADLKAAEDRLATVKMQRRGGVLQQLRDAAVRQAATAVAEAESAIRVLEHQHVMLKTDVDKAGQEAEKIGRGSIEVSFKRREMTDAETLMGKLRLQKEQLAVEMQTYKRRVNVTSAAEASAAKPAASALTGAAGLGGAGFLLGLLGVGFLESQRRRLIHLQDVAHAMRLPVLGHLPLVSSLADAPLVGVWGDQFGVTGSLLAEAVTDLRNRLLASRPCGRPPQVLMVTSAVQGEGKTTLACLLALSMAQLGKRTLLIDADLRNPRVTERLGVQSAAGLGEVLRGEARPAGVIGGVPGTPLAIMTAGRPCANIIRGLSAEGVSTVFAELRTLYDYIIVDTCPTPLSDGLVIGACVDAAVLVVRSGQSAEPLVREACERMLAVRVPLVGGVVNGLPLGRRSFRYPYTTLPASQDREAEVPLAIAPKA